MFASAVSDMVSWSMTKCVSCWD